VKNTIKINQFEAAQHRQEVDRNRTFYQTIAYAKLALDIIMVQTALRNRSAAAHVLGTSHDY